MEDSQEINLSLRAKSVTITWRNLSAFALDTKKQHCKQVLNNVRGAVKPGELTCILGGSGSGKTTLMTALAFRNPSSLNVQGEIRVNGRLADSAYMRERSGYMYQDDIFIGTMTVSEHLWFMARMKLDRNVDHETISTRIQSLLFEVGLSSRSNARIGTGDENKVLSGGEKKRLAFATELLSDPSILFLDEPTTGLDAHSASILVLQLQTFCSKGRTVLCTIHQPSSAVFNSFNKIILIAEGRIAFSGTQKQAINFFTSLGHICPRSYNPADFLVSMVATTNSNNDGTTRSVQRICDAFLSSDACKEIDLILKLEIHLAESYDSKRFPSSRIRRRSPYFWRKLFWLVHRGFLQVVRDPAIQLLRILQKLVSYSQT